MDSRQSTELKEEIKKNKNSVTVKGIGPSLFGYHALGKVSFVKTAQSNMKELLKLMDEFDQQDKGRQTSVMIDYFVAGPFINSRTGEDARRQHLSFTHSLSRPKDYIQYTLEEIQKSTESNLSISLNDFVRLPVLASLVHGMFGVQLEEAPDYKNVLDVFEGILNTANSDWMTKINTRLVATYYPSVFNLKSDFREARQQYIDAAEKFLSNQADEVLHGIDDYVDGVALSHLKNVLTYSVLELIREKHPEYKNNPFEFRRFLDKIGKDEVKEYLYDYYIRTIPGSVAAGSNVVLIVGCALVALAKNPKLRDALREELSELEILSDTNPESIQRIIESDRRENGLLNRVYLESLRRETMLKSSEQLDFDSNLWRYTDKNIEFDHQTIPAKSAVVVLNGMLRFDPEFWDEPGNFDLDRFIETQNDQQKDKQKIAIAESVFSHGSRVCPANKISEYIIKVMLAYMVMHYDWDLEYKDEKNATLNNVIIHVKSLENKQELEMNMSQAMRN